MTTTSIKKRILTMALATALTAFVFPAAAVRAVSANPDTLKTPGVYDKSDEGYASMKDQIASLKKIIELNVKKAEKIPVLLYHHLAKEAEMTEQQKKNDSVMSVEQFSEQMKYLYDNKYYTASLSEFELFLAGKMTLPERTVVLTFDDGYRSNTKYAYPMLKKYDFKAAIFLISNLIGEKENVIEHAGWGDMKKCADVFSYHSHSHSLHRLRPDGKGHFITSDSTAVTADLLQSKALLSTSYFSYPYGQTGRAGKKALTDSGFRMAFTTVSSYATRKADVLELPRFTITAATDIEIFGNICMGGAVDSPETSAAESAAK